MYVGFPHKKSRNPISQIDLSSELIKLRTVLNYQQLQAMVDRSGLLVTVEDGTYEEQAAPHQEGDVDALLQYLDMPIRSLIYLTRVINSPKQPENRPSDQQVQSMLLQLILNITLYQLQYISG